MIKGLSTIIPKNFCLTGAEVHRVISKIKSLKPFEIDFLEVIFVSKEKILEYNIKYLKHDYETDIITLSYNEDKDNVSGIMFICYEVAKENANYYAVSLKEELVRLIIHGILHLLGYNDATASDKKVMKREEDSLLKIVLEN